MGASLLVDWQQARPAQRFAYLVGGTLILVGLAHLAAWLVLGGAWQGPVSLRKPTTFGISFGLTTSTLAWITGRLRICDRSRWLLLGPLAVADTYEVAWVAVQRWRGLAPWTWAWPPRCCPCLEWSCWAPPSSRRCWPSATPPRGPPDQPTTNEPQWIVTTRTQSWTRGVPGARGKTISQAKTVPRCVKS
jgi:hypothetical protein